MAARTAARHQSMLHFVGVATWSDEALLAKVREMCCLRSKGAGRSHAWIIPQVRQAIRLACVTTIAVSCASRPIAKWRGCSRSLAMPPTSGRLSALLAGSLGGSRTPEEGGYSEGNQFRGQTGVRVGADALGLRRRLAARCRIDRCDLRQRLAVARGGITALRVLYATGILPTTLMWRPGTGPRQGQAVEQYRPT